MAGALTLKTRRMILVLFCFLVSSCVCGFGQVWHTETLDPGNGHDVGQYSALAIDRDGDLHAAYWDATAGRPWGQLRYAYRAPGDQHWSRMVVDTDGLYVSMAVDSRNHPHLAYDDGRERGLHYAYWDGKQWRRQIVDSGHVGFYNSIQVDAEGHPKISYYLDLAPTGEYWLRLKYAYFDGSAWYIQTVDPRMHTGKMNSLALDADGRPYISYSYFATTHDIFYAHLAGPRWQYGAADTQQQENALLGQGNDIAVDSKGHPHIAYYDNTKNNLKYASWDGTHWVAEVVDHLTSIGYLDHISLKIDHRDRPQIAYDDAGLGVLKYASWNGKTWQIETVDQGNVGLRPSLALDGHDQPYICYYDLSNHALRLAYRAPGSSADMAKSK
jgi:hypothetical protein